MLPVLIVSFARKEKVENTVNTLIGMGRQVLIFVDNAGNSKNVRNKSMLTYARSLSRNGTATVRISDSHLGVGKAVPEAIEWALKKHPEIIIVEDDCAITAESLDYFDKMITLLDSDIKIVSGLSPYDFSDTDIEALSCTLSHFPLIWGWATNRDSWKELWEGRAVPMDIRKVFVNLLKRNINLTTISFFKAAIFRIKREKLKAWDAEMAYYFVLRDFKSVIPNKSLIVNSGFDQVASNTDFGMNQYSDQVNSPSDRPLVLTLDMSSTSMKLTDKLIKRRIYKMRRRHLFAYPKALIIG